MDGLYMVYIWFIMENPTKNGWFCGEKPMGHTFPRLQDAGYRASWEDAGVVGKAVYASGTQIRCLTWKVLHKKIDMKWKKVCASRYVYIYICIYSLPWNVGLIPFGWLGCSSGAHCGVVSVWVLSDLGLWNGRHHVEEFFGALTEPPYR